MRDRHLHLSVEEFVDALDAALPVERMAHLDACEACRAQLDRVEITAVATAASDEVPEPSPLFWTSMRQRVQDAVEHAPGRGTRWGAAWRWIASTAAVATAVLVAITMQHPLAPPAGSATMAVESGMPDTPAPDALHIVAGMAATVPYDELRAVTQPSAAAADELVSRMTDDERAELARLIQVQVRTLE